LALKLLIEREKEETDKGSKKWNIWLPLTFTLSELYILYISLENFWKQQNTYPLRGTQQDVRQ
jgi:hypothetical protein